MSTTYAPAPATAKQIGFIESLMKTRKNGAVYVGTQLASYGVDSLEAITKSNASNIIGVLLGEPEVAVEKSAKPAFVTIEPGFYCDPIDPAKVWKIQKSKNSDRTYALELVVKGGHDGFTAKGSWVFRSGAMKNAKNWVPLSLEKAAEFGKKTGVCCCCGRTLTNPDSIAAGIGPICAGGF